MNNYASCGLCQGRGYTVATDDHGHYGASFACKQCSGSGEVRVLELSEVLGDLAIELHTELMDYEMAESRVKLIIQYLQKARDIR